MNSVNLFSHAHGGSRRMASDGSAFVDFSVNVSPVLPPIPDFPLSAFALDRYPSIDGCGVREFYVRRFGLKEETVLAINGAIEGLYLLPRAFSLKRVLVPVPSFFDYARACRLAGAEVERLLLLADSAFAYPGVESLAQALEGCDAFIAASPNNPTGSMLPVETVLALACWFPGKIFIVDEAFIQYTEGFPASSLMKEVTALQNLVVVHSLAKFYALPGLRLGAVIAHPALVRRLYDHKEPWTVNAIAEDVAWYLLQCGVYEQAVRDLVAEERSRIAELLRVHSSVKLYGGSANYFLACMNSGYSLDTLIPFLARRRMLVRDCRNFEGLDGAWFRFSIRTPEENNLLLDALNLFAMTGDYR